MTELTEFYPKDPISLTLTSDYRLCQTDPLYDLVWELQIGRGEPACVSLYSTFGLRAKEFKMFPRFIEGDSSVSNPEDFDQPVAITTLYPSMMRLNFSPIMGINVTMAVCVPTSNTLSIQIQLQNTRLNHRTISIDWISMLSPGSQGHRMKGLESESIQFLQGQTEEIFPIAYMSGVVSQGSGSFPSLTQEFSLPAGATDSVQIHFSAFNEIEKSVHQITQLRNMNWDLECARLENTNQSYIHISSGDKNLDTLLYSSQVSALQHVISLNYSEAVLYSIDQRPVLAKNFPSQNTTPDSSESLLSVWENFYLSTILLPIQPADIAAIIKRYFKNQETNGRIDVPLSAQDPMLRHHVAPFLAALSLSYYQKTNDRKFLQSIYPNLLDYFNHWFDPINDPDQDGIPNFRSPLQIGLDNHPIFIPYHTTITPVDSRKVESPAICALLFREGKALIEIARILENSSPITAIITRVDQMQAAVIASWSGADQSFHYWDIDSHDSPEGKLIAEMAGPGEFSLTMDIPQPSRIGVRVLSKETKPTDFGIFIHGTHRSGADRIERISNEQLLWRGDEGIAITDVIFVSITEVEIFDIQEKDTVQLFIPDYQFQDISLLSSLAIHSDETMQIFADTISYTLMSTERFWGTYGIRTYIKDDIESIGSIVQDGINIPWNQYLGEILIDMGYREQAWDLFKRLSTPMIKSVASTHRFYSHYHHDTGEPFGSQGTLIGLPPLQLFLRIIGIEKLSREEIVLHGYNPTRNDVVIHFQGITITAAKSKFTVKYPGGQTIVVRDPEMQVIKLDYSGSDS